MLCHMQMYENRYAVVAAGRVGIVEETNENDLACGMVMCRVIPFYDETLPEGWRQRGLVKTKYLKTLLLPGQMLMEEA